MLPLMLYLVDSMDQLDLRVVDGGHPAVAAVHNGFHLLDCLQIDLRLLLLMDGHGVHYRLYFLYRLQINLRLLVNELTCYSLNLSLAQVGEHSMLDFLVDIVYRFCMFLLVVDERAAVWTSP